MEQRAVITLDGQPTTAQPTGTSIQAPNPPNLPARPLLVQRRPVSPPVSDTPPGTVIIGGPSIPASDRVNGAWPWTRPDPGAPPRVAGLTYDHTEYEDGTLHITLMEVHVPPAPEATATATDSFDSAASGGAEFELPAGILSGGVTGKVSISRSSTYTVTTCTRVEMTQPVQYARHFYRQGDADPDMVVTLLSHVYDTGVILSTVPITTCTCRTRRAPAQQFTKSITVDPGTTSGTTVTRANNLNLTASAGFKFDLPLAGGTSFSLTAGGDLTRTTSIDVTLPGGYTYEQYDIGGVTYWEAR